MTDVFVIRDQNGHYWGKSKQWVDGSEARTVFRTRHNDEAINLLFELSSKNIELRGEVVGATLNQRGDPQVQVSDIPLPGVDLEPAAEESGATAVVEQAMPEAGSPGA
jgi:hypothetical protein